MSQGCTIFVGNAAGAEVYSASGYERRYVAGDAGAANSLHYLTCARGC
jgi:hypothetical protein